MLFINSYLQQAPAETTKYMIAGYAVIFMIIFLYLVSMYIRFRNMKRAYKMFMDLDTDTE